MSEQNLPGQQSSRLPRCQRRTHRRDELFGARALLLPYRFWSAAELGRKAPWPLILNQICAGSGTSERRKSPASGDITKCPENGLLKRQNLATSLASHESQRECFGLFGFEYGCATQKRSHPQLLRRFVK